MSSRHSLNVIYFELRKPLAEASNSTLDVSYLIESIRTQLRRPAKRRTQDPSDRDRGEPRGAAPPTPPCVRVRTRRFAGLSADDFCCVHARGSDRGLRRAGFGPLSSAVRASPIPAAPKASDLDFSRMASLRFPTPRSFQRSGLRRSSLRLLCRLLTSPPRSQALRPAQSGCPDTPEISRGKTDRLHRALAGFTNPGP